MNSNFGSFSDSNWGSLSNSKLEEKWVQMRQEDEESDKEIQVRRNKHNRATTMVATMVCQPTKEQPQYGGSVHDLLERSPLFNRLIEVQAPQLDYYFNDRQYNMRYYLADVIYPKWATLVQAIPNPRNDAEKLFTLHQEAYQKDVERAFDRYTDGESDDDQEDPNRSRRARAKVYDGPNLPFNPRIDSISINEYMRIKPFVVHHLLNSELFVKHFLAKKHRVPTPHIMPFTHTWILDHSMESKRSREPNHSTEPQQNRIPDHSTEPSGIPRNITTARRNKT
ncbi:hypothetical protein D8674_018684 [Pyrus ussuriensis x Pyrus communis]|uniref:Uncharacterized protein n=1 Tax=Pyrus ussuriensis x Pyrus communis TaxID=2448454 RepID=A0A5N5GB39_9ROSA|nr:hypothetical protein D8674_018684 [Pyrus ussuriensis x Pyrus communis]